MFPVENVEYLKTREDKQTYLWWLKRTDGSSLVPTHRSTLPVWPIPKRNTSDPLHYRAEHCPIHDEFYSPAVDESPALVWAKPIEPEDGDDRRRSTHQRDRYLDFAQPCFDVVSRTRRGIDDERFIGVVRQTFGTIDDVVVHRVKRILSKASTVIEADEEERSTW